MQRLCVCVVLVIMTCDIYNCKVASNQDESALSSANKMDSCNFEFSKLLMQQQNSEVMLAKLLHYHQGSVPELEQQVAEKIATIDRLKSEILHAENTLNLVSKIAEDAKQQETMLIKSNEECKTKVAELESSANKKIEDIVRVTNDINDKLESPKCDSTQEEKLKNDLSTSISTIKQLTEQLENNTKQCNPKKPEKRYIKVIPGGPYKKYSEQPLVRLGDGYYYFETTDLMNWESAKKFCQVLDLALVSVESKQENDLIKKHIREVAGSKSYWTSGNDLVTKGKFVWDSTGKPVTFTDWGVAEPNNSGGREEVIMFYPHKNLQWNDVGPANLLNALCEQQ